MLVGKVLIALELTCFHRSGVSPHGMPRGADLYSRNAPLQSFLELRARDFTPFFYSNWRVKG
jgi:hypothetical protein